MTMLVAGSWPGFFLVAAKRRIRHSQIQLPSINIDSSNDHANRITQAKLTVRPTASQFPGRQIEDIEIITERTQMNHAFRWNRYALTEHAETLDARDNGIHFFTDAFGHVAKHPDANQFAFCFFRSAFRYGAMLSQLDKFRNPLR